jgi:hypothetical protein
MELRRYLLHVACCDVCEGEGGRKCCSSSLVVGFRGDGVVWFTVSGVADRGR